MIHRSLRIKNARHQLGFVVLCPPPERHLQTTLRSLDHLYWESSAVVAFSESASDEALSAVPAPHLAVRGRTTISSLINAGMRATTAPWNVIVFAGTYLRPRIARQVEAFVHSERDILFQVVEGRTNFVDGSMNGVILHRDAFKAVGDWSEERMARDDAEDLAWVKLLWATRAIECGCCLKAILGMPVE